MTWYGWSTVVELLSAKPKVSPASNRSNEGRLQRLGAAELGIRPGTEPVLRRCCSLYIGGDLQLLLGGEWLALEPVEGDTRRRPVLRPDAGRRVGETTAWAPGVPRHLQPRDGLDPPSALRLSGRASSACISCAALPTGGGAGTGAEPIVQDRSRQMLRTAGSMWDLPLSVTGPGPEIVPLIVTLPKLSAFQRTWNPAGEVDLEPERHELDDRVEADETRRR